MLTTVDAALAELEEEPDAPEGESSLQLLLAIYKDKKQPLNVRVRCAVEALAHEYPKLSAVAHKHFDFASELEKATIERAWERSQSPYVMNTPPALPGPKTIEHQEHSAEELRGPMARLERRR